MTRTRTPLKERILKHVEVDEETGCWNWTGDLNAKGYGRIRPEGGKDGEKIWVHRAAYQVFKGPIPDGKQIDHLCRNTKCCNAEHLEVVSPELNLSRAQFAKKFATQLPVERKEGEGPRVEKMLELGNGLWIYKIHIDELKEQDVNARSMPKQMFDRLSTTIGRDARLESLPYVAETDKGLEIVSGHHRTRAARAAGVQEIHAIVDTSQLTPSQIRAKQIAHNAIAGEDNAQLLAKIYESIEDVDDRLEAYVDPENLDLKIEKISVDNVEMGLEFIQAIVVFMPLQKEAFDRAAEALAQQGGVGGDVDTVYIGDLEFVERWKQLVKRVGDEYDIRSLGTTMGLMGEIVLSHLDIPEEELDAGLEAVQAERTHLRDIIGQTYIPLDAADTIARAVDKIAKDEKLTKRGRWQALELMAADYLGGA